MIKASLVTCSIRFPNLLARLVKNEDRIYKVMTASLQTNRAMMFDQEGAYNGHPKWAALKYRNGQILSKTGVLRKSIAPANASGNTPPNGYIARLGNLANPEVRMGTVVKYAAVHNFGANIKVPAHQRTITYKVGKRKSKVISAVKGRSKANEGKIVTRQVWVKPYEINIPKRNFTDVNDQDTIEVGLALQNLILGILNDER